VSDNFDGNNLFYRMAEDKMSETKALDKLLDDSNWTGWKFIFGNNVKCKNTFQHENTDLLDEAAAELEELHNCIDKLEGELAAEVSTKIQLRAKLRSMEDNEEWSSDKIVELAETIAQLRRELDEARKVLDMLGLLEVTI
jgi:chromosome segregation ATPase